MATPKQVNYAIYLMDRAGYGTDWMRSEHKAFGATVRERRGKVRDWLAGMERHAISRLIDRLKQEV